MCRMPRIKNIGGALGEGWWRRDRADRRSLSKPAGTRPFGLRPVRRIRIPSRRCRHRQQQAQSGALSGWVRMRRMCRTPRIKNIGGALGKGWWRQAPADRRSLPKPPGTRPFGLRSVRRIRIPSRRCRHGQQQARNGALSGWVRMRRMCRTPRIKNIGGALGEGWWRRDRADRRSLSKPAGTRPFGLRSVRRIRIPSRRCRHRQQQAQSDALSGWVRMSTNVPNATDQEYWGRARRRVVAPGPCRSALALEAPWHSSVWTPVSPPHPNPKS